MIWLLLILFVPGGKNQEPDASRSYKIIRPCDSNDIVAIMWPQIPSEHPIYKLTMPLGSGSNLLLKFDSPLIYPRCGPGVEVSSRGNNTIYIERRNALLELIGYDLIVCNITIPMNSFTIPYVQSIVLNETDQLCENPKNHYFDNYIIYILEETTVAPNTASSNVPVIVSPPISNKTEENQHYFDDFIVRKTTVAPNTASSNVPVIVSPTMSNKKEENNYDNEFKSTTIRSPLVPSIEPNVPHSEVTSPSLGQTCGRQKVLQTALIVHGQASKAAHWPWHVALFRIEKRSFHYICGGTLLSKTVVVTAGHCASIRGGAIIPELLRVDLGMHELFRRDIGQQEREVFKVILHPGFNGTTLDNDIALLKLQSEVIFTNYVQPACLWYEQAIYKFNPMFIFGTVAGWGFDHQDSLSNILQQITIPLVSNFTCLRSNPTFFSRLLNGNKFCAGFANGTAVCNGDSGGGLMIFVPETPGGSTAGAWHVRGIVSVAPSIKERNVCDPYQFTTFTDVEKYRDWVLGYLG